MFFLNTGEIVRSESLQDPRNDGRLNWKRVSIKMQTKFKIIDYTYRNHAYIPLLFSYHKSLIHTDY